MNDYYNAPTIYDFTRARATQPNSEANATEAAFDLLPTHVHLDFIVRAAMVAGGTADALTVTYVDPLTSYALGQKISFQGAAPNTGPTTVNVDGLGVKALIRISGTQLEAGDIQNGRVYEAVYDGSQFQLISGVLDLTAGGIGGYIVEIEQAVADAQAAAAAAAASENDAEAAAATFTPASQLADIKTVDGTGSGLDADLVRGTTPGAGGLAILALAVAPAGTIVGTTDTQTMTNKTLLAPAITDPVITGALTEDIYTITDGVAFEIDPSNGTLQSVTLGASRTPAATNFANGESVTLRVNDGSAFTITWTTLAVAWISGTAPSLATSGWTWIELWKMGGTIYGTLVGNTA